MSKSTMMAKGGAKGGGNVGGGRSNPNWPSKTGSASGPGRGNYPPPKK